MNLTEEQKQLLVPMIQEIVRSIDSYIIGEELLDPLDPETGEYNQDKFNAIVQYVGEQLSIYYGCN
jgi:hypothetical protein